MATDQQLDALNILLTNEPGGFGAHGFGVVAVTLTEPGDLLVKIKNREYLIDPAGTVTHMHYNDAQQTI